MTPTPQPPTPGAALAATNLTRLGRTIDAEVKSWMSHLRTLNNSATYESITSSGNTSLATKAAALKHILETLPARHKALTDAYNVEETGEQIELSDQCAGLLKGLKAQEVEGTSMDPSGTTTNSAPNNTQPQQTQTQSLDLEDYYDFKLFKGKKFRNDVLAQDTEIRELEQGRLHGLKEVMAMFEELKILYDEGELEVKQVQLLVMAMDGMGFNAIPVVREGGE